ncbi:Uncharacterised protein [Salmonella enterica subsp. enterica serovar Bovismorbificans]|nr:Uncharacterised protein [Salmonella enterica subsp. enterica serovar Bovismorbificans]CPR72617.1 Uncharacterised protein [Salmonella enterica subsp. enterica serovar Bovismorbificans]
MTLEVRLAHHNIRIGRLAQQTIGVQQLRAGFYPFDSPFSYGHWPGQPREHRIQGIRHIPAIFTQREAAVERKLHIRPIPHAIMAQRTAKAMRFNALQLRIRHSRDVNKAAHP